ncbi:MAG: LysM domain-containing protein, partial [Azonexus sp.]|nr:LysM domain-containing protein [Azonexus sp.]
PSHNRPVIMRDSAVVIPEDKLQIFQNNLKKYTAPLTKWQAYTIKAGEKISKVAARFGITLTELYEANGLHPRVSVMHGSAILVPAGFGAIDLANLENMTAPRIIEPRAAKQTQNKSSKYVPRGTARQVVKSSRR